MTSTISTQLPILMIIAPLFSAVLTMTFGLFNKKLCSPIAIIGTGLASFFAIQTLATINMQGDVFYFLGGWIPPIGIEYAVDYLNGIMLVLISVVSFFSRCLLQTLGRKRTL